MYITSFSRHKTLSLFQTLLLTGVMISFLALLGLVIAGKDGILIALAAGIFLILLYPSLDPAFIARIYGVKPLLYDQTYTSPDFATDRAVRSLMHYLLGHWH